MKIEKALMVSGLAFALAFAFGFGRAGTDSRRAFAESDEPDNVKSLRGECMVTERNGEWVENGDCVAQSNGCHTGSSPSCVPGKVTASHHTTCSTVNADNDPCTIPLD
jgi:hypothetical protein